MKDKLMDEMAYLVSRKKNRCDAEEIICGAAKIGIDFSYGKPDRWYLAVKKNDSGVWVKIYRSRSKRAVVEAIDEIISDLMRLKQEG